MKLFTYKHIVISVIFGILVGYLLFNPNNNMPNFSSRLALDDDGSQWRLYDTRLDIVSIRVGYKECGNHPEAGKMWKNADPCIEGVTHKNLCKK